MCLKFCEDFSMATGHCIKLYSTAISGLKQTTVSPVYVHLVGTLY